MKEASNGESLKNVDDFLYLGSWIGCCYKDVKVRIGETWSTLHKLDTIWKSELSNDLKIIFFRATVWLSVGLICVTLCFGRQRDRDRWTKTLYIVCLYGLLTTVWQVKGTIISNTRVVFASWLLNVPPICKTYPSDRSTQTTGRAATLRQKLPHPGAVLPHPGAVLPHPGAELPHPGAVH